MRKAILTTLGALLVTLSAIQMTAASERNARRARDRWDFLGSYNQLNGPSYAVPQTQAQRNIENFGFSGRDPSRPGGWDTSLNLIARLKAAGLNATVVQNPLTTPPEAVASAERVLARQDGPTVLVGHSFSGMIVTEAGMHPNVSALVYVAARAPDAGEDCTTLAKTFPTPPRLPLSPSLVDLNETSRDILSDAGMRPPHPA
jgi:hypothetical protein